MMEPITFFAEGIPKGQPRPKAFSRGGHASVYDPGTAEGWKGQVAVAAKEYRPERPLEGPLSLQLLFLVPRPKGHYRSGARSSELRAAAPIWHTGKPDADNFAKAVMDALTVLRFWMDDSQVADLHVRKGYANGFTGCQITITEVAP